MLHRSALAVFLLVTASLAQTPSPCPADRPVDDIINEVHKTQSKKNNRNTNPFPDVTCIFGWCRGHSKTPPTVPQPDTHSETSESNDTPPEPETSAAKSDCDEAMDRALKAAHSVEVGDFNFADKNFRGALMRYQDAVDAKPQDAAIHVRMGRSYEKLQQVPQALEQYSTAQKLSGPQKWLDEAKTALQRLQK